MRSNLTVFGKFHNGPYSNLCFIPRDKRKWYSRAAAPFVFWLFRSLGKRLTVSKAATNEELFRGCLMRRFLFCLAAPLFGMGLVAWAGECQAQSSKAGASPKSGTRLITLGTRSGPTPTVGRAQSSNLLIVNGAHYVIDAGDGVTRRLTRLKTNFRDIGNIFITHPHSDHTSGLGALMTVMYDAGRADLV